MFSKRVLSIVFSLSVVVFSQVVVSPRVFADDDETLADLSMADLLDTEINLDDTFDIFGALVSTQKVSVATGKRQDAFLAPAVTSVITAQDMEAMGTRTLGEALQTVPGLYVGRDLLYQPLYVMRGITSTNNPEILVMINGVPFKGLESGNRGTGWRDMPVNGIARIEVIRGPGSALYGADAFSGTINIVTKTVEDINGTETGLRIGSFDTYEGWILHGKRHGDYAIASSVEFTDTDGLDARVERDAQTLLDEQLAPLGIAPVSLAPGEVNAEERSLDARVDVSRKNWRARLGYMGRRDVGTPIGAGSALDDWGQTERDRFNADLIYDNPIFTPNWHVTAQLNYVYDITKTRLGIFPPGMSFPLEIDGQFRLLTYPEGAGLTLDTGETQTHVGISGFYAGFDKHLLRVGAGYRYEDLFDVKYSTNIGFDENAQPILPGSPMRDMTDTAGAVYPEKMRKSHYVFLQDSWQLAQKLDLTWGLRYDRYSDFGSTTNPRAALVWQATPNLTVKALYGRAFRAPSFRDLYTRNNALLLGNSELDAETNETTELALNWRASGALNVGFNLYQFEIKDKILAIDTDVATQQALITVNEGQLDGHGVELEARWKFSSRASVLFNYSWMDTELILPAEDEAGHETHGHEDDSDESGLPKQQAYLRVDWLIKPKWYLNTQLTWIGEQARIKHTDSRPPIDDYTSVDLTLRYKDTRQQRWNFALGVRNLFDKAIRVQADENLPGDIPLAGRNYFAEIRYRFD